MERGNEMKLKWVVGCAVAVGLFWALPCFAEDEDETVYDLGTIVVKENPGIKDIAITNEVTEKQILEMGANNVAEALKFTPGIHFSYKNRGYQPIIMQGIGQDQILLLIDGLPVVPGGGELDLNSIPASIISRIEITKGASSVLYGANTLGGVINIVTKKSGKGFHGNVRAEVGENGYNHESGSVSYGGEKYSGLVLLDHTSRDSYELSDDYEPLEERYAAIEDGGKRQNSQFESTNFWTRVGCQCNENTEIYLNGFSFNVDREVPPNTETTNPFKRKVKDYQVFGSSMAAKTRVTDWMTLRGVLFAQKRSQTIEEYSDIALTELSQKLPDESKIFGVNFYDDMKLCSFNSLSLSAHIKSEHLEQDTEPVDASSYSQEAKAYTMSFGVEDTTYFGNNTLVAGVSFNQRKLYDVTATDGATGGGSWKGTIDPSIGISHDFSDGTHIYTSIAQKTTFPSIDSTWDDETAMVYDLDPERDVVTILGADRAFANGLSLGISGFHHDISDKIVRGDSVIPENAGTLRLYGAEAELSYIFNARLSAGIDYSYTCGSGSAVTETTYGDEVKRHLYGFQARYRIPLIESSLSTYARYTVDNYDDYGRSSFKPRGKRYTFDMDLSLSKRFDNNLEVIARVKNLFDKNIEYEAGQPLEGRTFRLSLGYYF